MENPDVSANSAAGDVPRLPAPPPNPRHKQTKGEGDITTQETPSSTVDDMSTSAQIDVTLDEVQPSFGNTSNPDSSFAQFNPSSSPSEQIPMPESNAVNNNNSKQSEGSNIPVYYSKRHGDVAVRTDNVLPATEDGQPPIQTSHYQSPPNRYENQRPLTQRYQMILKIVSVAALVVFFPTGIPAVYFAFKMTKEFNEGLLRGNIDTARKCASRAEKLIIFSFLLSIMVIVLSLALYERSKWTEEQLARSQHRILPSSL